MGSCLILLPTTLKASLTSMAVAENQICERVYKGSSGITITVSRWLFLPSPLFCIPPPPPVKL